MRVWYLCLSASLFLGGFPLLGQETTEEAMMKELDSLYRVIFTFNYADDTTTINDFESFERRLSVIEKRAYEQELNAPYFQARNIWFLHFKYQEMRQEATRLLDETIATAREWRDEEKEVRFVYFKGNLSFRFDDFDSAVYYFQDALSMARAMESLSLQAASINALAVCYAQLGRDMEATTYYKESYAIAQQIADKKQVLTAALNLSNVYGRLEQADSALYFGQEAYHLAIELDETSLYWSCLNALSVAHLLKGNFSQTIAYAKDLEQAVLPIGETGFLITSYLTRSKALFALGNAVEALSYAEKSRLLAIEYGAVDNEQRTLKWLVELSSYLNDFKQALYHQQRLSFLEDSLSRIAVNERLEKLAIAYETDKKQAALENLELLQAQTAQKLRFRNLMIGAIVVAGLLLVLWLVYFFKRRVEKEKIAQQKAQNELLRTQLNPHFLFNALSSIQLFLINQGQGSHALEYLSKFAKLMRRILENSRKDFVSLEEEIVTLRHYLDLQKVRFENAFDYTLDVNVEDHLSEIKIPPMFAQPFIENSLEHGISSIKNGLIAISFQQKGDTMLFKVEDNGVGLSRSAALRQNKEHVSLATKITRDRIELLKRQLKKNISFVVKDRLNETNEVVGTEVIFEIPIQF